MVYRISILPMLLRASDRRHRRTLGALEAPRAPGPLCGLWLQRLEMGFTLVCDLALPHPRTGGRRPPLGEDRVTVESGGTGREKQLNRNPE
jgi:hypothetical protein